jgi:hypothetical protein
MSKIQTLILAACTGLAAPKLAADRQPFLTDCLRAIDKLDDKQYEKLDDSVVDWFNKAADVAEANKKARTRTRCRTSPTSRKNPRAVVGRRRRAADDERAGRDRRGPAWKSRSSRSAAASTRARGREDRRVIVLKIAGEEIEIDMARSRPSVFNDGAAGAAATSRTTPSAWARKSLSSRSVAAR